MSCRYPGGKAEISKHVLHASAHRAGYLQWHMYNARVADAAEASIGSAWQRTSCAGLWPSSVSDVCSILADKRTICDMPDVVLVVVALHVA